jgi:HlyD family secretion protein
MRPSTTIACCLAAAGAVMLLGCFQRHGQYEEDRTREAPLPKDVAIAQTVHGIGYVEPTSEVRSLSFKTGGVIARCLVNVGDTVRKGDPLMALDDAQEQKAVAVAESELEVAKAERADVFSGVNEFQIRAAERAVEMWTERVDFAAKEAARCESLIGTNAISQSQCDEAKTSLQQASAELRRAKAELEHLRNFVTPEDRQLAEAKVGLVERRLELAKQALANTRLAAPFDGTVLEILRREGEAVSILYHEPVILFGDVSRLRVRAEIDERYVHQLREGQTALVSGRGLGDESYQGRVVLIKKIMGRKTVFSRAASERRDLDVVQVLIEMDGEFSTPVGLRVDVRLNSTEINQ